MSADSNMIARLETLFYSLVSVAHPMPIGEAEHSPPNLYTSAQAEASPTTRHYNNYARGYQFRRLGDMMRA